MAKEPQRILLTGPPGCGKTTAVIKVVDTLQGRLRMAGFYTQEIREGGRRKGFRWHCLDDRTGVLAHIDIKGPYRVGKYGVDIRSFDKEAVSVLDARAAEIDVFVVDEIGKMECFSEAFVEALRRLLHSRKSILATVAQKGPNLIQEVKSAPGVQLLHLSAAHRDEVVQQVIDMLAGLAD
jgi:nucleoside-triphosphatase